MYNSNSDNNNNWCWKFPGKTFMRKFQYTVFENKLSFMKKVVLHIFTLIQYKARQVLYAIYLVLTREMAQEWHLWHELLKSTSNIWKPSYDWVTLFKKQSEGINYIVMKDLNLWQILAEILLELLSYKH